MVHSFILGFGLFELEVILIVWFFYSSEVVSVFQFCFLGLGDGFGSSCLAWLSVESFKLLFVEEFGDFSQGVVILLAGG